MKRLTAVALSPAGGTDTGGELGVLELDPDVEALIAEVDAILSAALAAIRRPHTPLAIGCALGENRPQVDREVCRCAPRGGPVRRVRALERSPPGVPMTARRPPRFTLKGR
jgi:hypothetical protein